MSGAHGLALEPLDALIEEISRRGACVVLAVQEPLRPNGTYAVRKRFGGNLHMALGLCADLTAAVLEEMRGDQGTPDADDEGPS